MSDPIASSVMDVVVVGCGASGAAALRTLHDAGLRVLALEAADRVGGRINTVPFGNSVVDLGAQWCEGEKDNDVFELVKDLDVLGRPQPEEQVFLLSNGQVMSDVGKEIMVEFNSLLDSADKKNKQSIPEYLRAAVKSKSSLNDQPLIEPLLELFERLNHTGGQSEPTRAKSLYGLEEAWPCEGEFLLNWKEQGYKTLIDILLKSYPNPDEKIPVEILLNKEVETIKWKRMKEGADTTNPLVQVVCKDGSMYEAKCVIVTVSIGVLQERHEQMFKPALPKEKVNTIKNLQLCVLNKIYVQFTEPWWPKSPTYFNLVWKREDKDQLSREQRWTSEVYALSTVEYQPSVLCCWIYGEGAKAMEASSLRAVKDGVMKILEMFFKEFNVSEIVDIKRSQWSSNALIRGAYSYRCVDTERTDTGASQLGSPLYSGTDVPTVCFAGEATSPRRYGAVHGAVEAGRREAARVIQSINNYSQTSLK